MTSALKGFVPEIRSPLVLSLLDGLPDPAERQNMREQMGISEQMLEAPLSAVPLARYVALFEDVASRRGTPMLGARLGAKQTPADALGPLGFLFLAAPTLRQGLLAVARHIGVWQTGTVIALQMVSGVVFWSYRIESGDIWPRRQDAEYTLATMCAIIRARRGAAWQPVEIHFEHDEPSCVVALRKLFRAPLRFRQSSNRLLLEQSELDEPYETPFSCFVPYVEEYIRMLTPQTQGALDLVEQVREVVRGALSHKEVSLDWVARALERSPRSLQRHLAASNTNLRTIMKEVRRSEALDLLGTGSRLQSDIAHALGYADHTVFWRAFKSWTGTAPGDYVHRRKV